MNLFGSQQIRGALKEASMHAHPDQRHARRFIGYRSASGSTNALPVIPQDSSSTHNSTCADSSGTAIPSSCANPNHSSSLMNHLPNAASNLGAPASAAWHTSRMHSGAGAGDTPPSSSPFAIPGSPSNGGGMHRSNSDASGNWQSSNHTYQYATQNGSGPLQPRRGHNSCGNSASVACVPAFPPVLLSAHSPVSSPVSRANRRLPCVKCCVGMTGGRCMRLHHACACMHKLV